MNSKTIQPLDNKNALNSSIWFIPIIAFVLACYLFFNYINNKGPEITLYMNNAEGIGVSSTVVKFLNVNVGKVENIELDNKLNKVKVKLQLSKSVEGMIKKDTKFWIVKPRLDINGISGLGTLISGSYITFSKGLEDDKNDFFNLSDLPPINTSSSEGLRIMLEGDDTKTLSEGAPILFDNRIVGQIEQSSFNYKTNKVEYQIYINQKNTDLVKKSVRFFIQNGININTENNNFSIKFAPIPAIFTGAIAFKESAVRDDANVDPYQLFKLYLSEEQADSDYLNNAIYFTTFIDSKKDINKGDFVHYKGIKVGFVTDSPFFEKEDVANIFQKANIPIRFAIIPEFLNSTNKNSIQKDIYDAIDDGLVASIEKTQPILGSSFINLIKNKKITRVTESYKNTKFIASNESNMSDILNNVNNILSKLNNLEVEKVLSSTNQSLNELENVLKESKTLIHQIKGENIPKTLTKTLENMQKILNQFNDESNIYKDGSKAADNLNKVLNEARELIKQIKQKPNSFIFNSDKNDIIPKTR